jgi:DNA-binding MarR family transcriptional regulator
MRVPHPESVVPDALPDAVADDADSAVLAIMRMARALERVDAGLSPQQYRILKLAGAGGERSARLAERLAVAKPTLTVIADGLVAAGLARREAEPGDRRVVRLRLTDAGVAAVERADAAYGQWLGTLLELTGEGDRIKADLRLITTALDELRRSRHPAASHTSIAQSAPTQSAPTQSATVQPAAIVTGTGRA